MILGYVTYTYFLRDGCIALFAKASVLFRSASIPPRPGLFAILIPSNQSLNTLPPCRVRARELTSLAVRVVMIGVAGWFVQTLLKTLTSLLAKICVYHHNNCKYLFTTAHRVRTMQVLPAVLRLMV